MLVFQATWMVRCLWLIYTCWKNDLAQNGWEGKELGWKSREEARQVAVNRSEGQRIDEALYVPPGGGERDSNKK